MNSPTTLVFLRMIRWAFSTLFIAEILIMFGFVFTINNYLGNPKSTIQADGLGYFDYLPSLFEYKDLIRKDIKCQDNQPIYDRLRLGIYIPYGDYMVNKYPCGTAVLISPFYFAASQLAAKPVETNNAEISQVYHKAVFYAALFYLFLSLVFLRKLLKLYNVSDLNIVITQILLVFSTSVTIFVAQDASFSHIYSLFAITAFLFVCKLYFINHQPKYYWWASLLLGLIIILRPVNLIIILFLPFIAGSFSSLKSGIFLIFSKPKQMSLGLVIAIGVVSIQFILWYLQVGKPIIYSYQNEGFNFLSPQMINILFSYRKGLFIYTPVVFIALFSLIRLLFNKQYYLAFTWLGFFLILTYIFSSWWSWFYGGSYGLRAYIEFYPIFFILFALLIERLHGVLKIPILVMALMTIPLNVIQSWQYKNFYLHQADMNKRDYWRIFLKQDPAFRGLLWKALLSSSNYQTVAKVSAGDVCVPPLSSEVAFQCSSSEINLFSEVKNIHVSFENEFSDKERTILALSISSPVTNTNYYYHNPSLILYSEEDLNIYHRGLYNYSFQPVNSDQEYLIKLLVYTKENFVILKNLELRFDKGI